jgi:predicted ArsR family transcriptional regulator
MENLGPTPARHDGSGPALSEQRAHVLERLQRAGSAVTVDDLAAALDLHPNTVRKHLDGLVARGLAVRTTAPAEGRGRPAGMYAPAERTEPDRRVRDYAGLAAALAGHMARTSADPRRDALAAGVDWGRSLAAGTSTGTAAHARREVVALLTDLGFDPEADAAATRVRLRRCPLLDTALAYPDVVCSLHLGLVRGALIQIGADPDVAALEPFAEPGACRLDLRARRAGRTS